MKTLLGLSVLAVLAAGCSDYRADRDDIDYRAQTEWSEPQVSQPASSNLGQAESAGYLSPADASHPIEDMQ